MSRRAAIIIAAVALAVLVAACGSTGSSSNSSNSPSPASASWLYSTTSDRGTLKETGDGGYKLTLFGVDEHTIAFADRPDRDVEVIATGEFVAQWEKMFAGDSPNAVLVEHDARGATDSLVVVLRDPVYDAKADTLTYAVTVTADEVPDRVAALVGKAHAEVPAGFRESSLFIDSTETYDYLATAAPTSDPVVPPHFTVDGWPADFGDFPLYPQVGGAMAAPWTNGSYYLATVTGWRDDNTVQVTYADDATTRTVPYSDVRNIPWDKFAVGDHVLAVWSTKARFYPGTVTSVAVSQNGFHPSVTYTVQWDDGSPASQVPRGKIMWQ